jgi:diguanylate cyclase (GGDEF)-like protein
MHSEPADRPAAGTAGPELKHSGRMIFLLGPRAETSVVAKVLRKEGYGSRAFAARDTFLDATFSDPPWAVILWAGAPGLATLDVREILRHHLDPHDCTVILACLEDEACGGQEPPFSLPTIALPVQNAELLEKLKEAWRTEGEGSGGIPRILVVDDDQNIVLLGSHIVSGLGMIPLVAFDGAQAIEKVRQFKPDLVLLDINMPGIDGFDVIRFLKSDPGANLIPIIVFSARRSDEDKVRALRLGADDYVTKPFSITELSARIDRLLKRTRTGVSASSTTGLPGTVTIEQVLAERIRSGAELAVLYLDIDHFKAFNDCYGFTRGDSVIRQTGDLILETVRALGNPDDFVGHVGGDDFVAITTPARYAAVADEIIQRFDRIIPLYYDAKDRRKGGIEMADRRGHKARFPIMSLSVAVVTNEGRDFHHPAQIADVAAQLKKFAKTRPGSLWVKDQRGNGAPSKA